ncbi:DNA polymerase III subunit gamma/tau [Arundinibacter roseus]|uniref:DNA polymerase III subunit gamma/tau n=1 Tax=Arundinibacter roseus TaxID=2070510 RepID=A0A4R4KBG9_9BACT|nr:DNA polymerase III subunit gamma/tau [Arundinibacter roseus]TDB65108.1 DNA polymerase III subunit gamma/tau [Arundinibacter roseus]
MEHFVVSARKYRPITFDSVVGQAHITTTLKNAIRTNHLAQAFLFCGPRGVGKTTCARILAKTINCQNLSDDIEPCGACESCVSFQNNASFNIHELDAASNNSVEDIRNLIDQVRYPPHTGSYKIYIIDEVHMLSQSAFNAFLKTLEEPPGYAIFILATTEKHKILPTILSRCQIFDFNRIQPRDIADHLSAIALKEGIQADREALELIGQKADGGLRDALSMFDLNVTFSTNNELSYSNVLDNLHILDYDYYFKITDALLAGDIANTLIYFDEIIRKGFDGHLFLIGLLEHFRNLMVCKDPVTVSLLEVSENAKAKYLDQSMRANLSFLLSAMSIGSQCDINFKSSKNQRLHIELFLIKISRLPDILSIESLPGSGDDSHAALKKKAEPEVVLTTEPGSPAYQATAATKPTTTTTNNPAEVKIPVGSRLRSTSHLVPGVVAVQPKESVTQPSKTITPPPADRPKKPLTKENLILHWKEFAEIRKNQFNLSNEEVTLGLEPELDGDVIRLALTNDIQLGALNTLRNDLIGYLRQYLDAPTLSLEGRVAPQEVAWRPYTAQDKFNFLVEKNPQLQELQKVLGLDTDF